MNSPLRQKVLLAPPMVEAQNQTQIQAFAKSLSCPDFIAELLMQMGIDTPEAAQDYFFPSERNLHECCGIRDLNKAVDLLLEACAKDEDIVIHGDYDVDGVTGTALLHDTLKCVGFTKVHTHLPNRFSQGYGLCELSVRQFKEQGIQWILTVDTGIGAIPEIRLANELGLKVIVCDHHQEGETLPDALAIVNPNRKECIYANKQLSGVAVAWKLANHLLEKSGKGDATDFLDLVALGTLADLMPLIDENRFLVKKGLKLLMKSPRPGLKLLIDDCHLDREYPRAQDVLFRVTPILNAAGRMGDPQLALKLLLTKNSAEALHFLHELKECNKERRMWESMMVRQAVELVESNPPDLNAPVLIISSKEWNQGVIGIVASRLIDRFQKPVAVISIGDDGIGRASCRSIAGFNWLKALNECSELLLRFGGHCHAAGFTVDVQNIEQLKTEIISQPAQSLNDPKCINPGEIQTQFHLNLDEIDLNLMTWLHRMEPFGSKNPAPLFYAQKVQIQGAVKQVGLEHLRMRLTQGGKSFDAIAFQQKYCLEWLNSLTEFTIAFYPVWNFNKRNGKRSEKDIQIQITAFGI